MGWRRRLVSVAIQGSLEHRPAAGLAPGFEMGWAGAVVPREPLSVYPRAVPTRREVGAQVDSVLFGMG